MENKNIALNKLRQLTTKTGIYQHGKLKEPDPTFGYALEDQARALIVAHEFGVKDLEEIYLNFIIKAQNKSTFLNQYFYEDQRGFVEDITPTTVLDRQEAYGITLWALFSTNNFQNEEIKIILNQILNNSRLWVSPRAIATALLGFASLPSQDPLEEELTEKMQIFYKKVAKDDWKWFENYLTYANAILPWACWEISLSRKDKEMTRIAEASTRFLIDTCQINGVPSPIGNQGWYKKDGRKAFFDQQPIDAGYMVCCLEKAFRQTKDQFYLKWAEKWWKWFQGNNIHKISLIDADGGCFDGLTKEGRNFNQGAESNICFLLAYLSAKRLKLI